MRQIHTKRLIKFICLYLSVFLLVAGMCFDYAETDSFFACIYNYVNAATSENGNSTIESLDLCNLETIQKQDDQFGRSDLRCAGRKNMAKASAACRAIFSLPNNTDDSTRLENTSHLTKCLSHITILNYIHSQDGEK